MILFGLSCYTLAFLVVLWACVETARRARRRRNEAWTRKANVRARVKALTRRVPCAGCSDRFPVELATAYGKDAQGKALFLCPSCRTLFKEKK